MRIPVDRSFDRNASKLNQPQSSQSAPAEPKPAQAPSGAKEHSPVLQRWVRWREKTKPQRGRYPNRLTRGAAKTEQPANRPNHCPNCERMFPDF